MLKQIRAAIVALEEICFSMAQKELSKVHQTFTSLIFLSLPFSRD